MGKARSLINLMEQEDHLLSSGLKGFSKEKAKKMVNKLLSSSSKGFFRDDAWQAVNHVWKELEKADIEAVITDAKYNGSMPPSSKMWKFEIYFTNNNGRRTILYGVLTASGAGSVENPLDKYDIITYVG